MFLKTTSRAAFFAAVILTAFASSADARRRAYDDGSTITAYSRHGNGSVIGQVRPGEYAWQVQLPHGTWIDCRRSCEETLRVQTVDIFETDGRLTGYGTLQNQCGIFGCLELHYPR